MSSSKKSEAAAKKPAKLVKATSKTKKTNLVVLLVAALVVGFVLSFVVVERLDGKNAPKSVDKPIHTVNIASDNKEPIDLLIKKDEYVQFNSKDGGNHQIVQSGAAHSATSHGSTGAGADSGVFKGDEGYLLQFKEVGKYEFQDKLDSDYTITVIVYDPTKSADDIKIKP